MNPTNGEQSDKVVDVMKVGVFGAGGVGGYFGARLAQVGASVHLLARGAHLAVLREKGIRVVSDNGSIDSKLLATDDPEEIGACDFVLFCVKSTNTREAAEGLKPLLKEETAVVSLQNGIDNEQKIAEIIDETHVVGGLAYILSTISEPGVIRHEGTLARVVMGEMDGRNSQRLQWLSNLFTKANVDTAISDAIDVDLWRKFAMICATAGMTSAIRLPVGEIRESVEALAMFRRIVEEVIALALALGIALPKDTVENIMESVPKLPAEWYSSLHYDMTHGKPMELEALHGTVVRLARKHSVSVPMSEAIYGILDPWARRQSHKV